MSEYTSLYAPVYVAQLVDDVHRECGAPGAPKYRTVERAVRQLAEEEGSTDD